MRLNLRLMAGSGCVGTCTLSADDKKHPNVLPFTGTLLLLDQSSDKPPHGSRGHKIYVSKDVAEDRLSSLIGMGINYDPGNLDEHMPRNKVGVIDGAKIVGNKVVVNGKIWRKDFPEAVQKLKGRRDLGMSMELSDVFVKDAEADVWKLNDFQFTGATILKKDSAAYQNTSLAAQASLAAKAAATGEGAAMDKTKKKKIVVAAAGEGGVITLDALSAAIGDAVKESTKDLVVQVSKANSRISSLSTRFDDLVGTMAIQAAEAGGSEEEDDEASEVEAAADEDEEEVDDVEASEDEEDEDDEDIDAAKDEKDDDEEDDASDVDAELEDLEDKPAHSEPGKVNHGMKTKGKKTTTTDVGAEGEKGGVVKAAAASIRRLSASNRELKKKFVLQATAHKKDMKKMKNKLERMDAALAAAAESTGRRSVIPVDLLNLAAKSNIDLNEIQASGAKITVAQADAMIAAAGFDASPEQKMTWKNNMSQAGLLEEGRIVRDYAIG
jgi:hypothetical protein